MESNITKKRQEQIAMDKAIIKRDRFGSLSLTAQDQRDLRGLPDEKLTGENEGKAEYEIMNDQEILEYMDEAEQNVNHPDIGHIMKERFKRDIVFLRKVKRLPEKYINFDISQL